MEPEKSQEPEEPVEAAAPEPDQNVKNPLAVMQPGEQVLFVLKRHPIGIIFIYVVTGLILTVLAVLSFGIIPSAFSGETRDSITAISAVIFIIFALLCLVFNFISTIVYWGNKWILTDDSLTQISQSSLFHKESSQLGLESLEDMTVEKKGILAHVFNYGWLRAETAAHQGKFIFHYAPNPNSYAQKVLQAHEAMNERIQLPRGH